LRIVVSAMRSSEHEHRGAAPAGAAACGPAPGPGVTEARADFVDFYDSEYHVVVRFMMRCGASMAAAEDAAQEAFIDLWVLTSRPDKWAQVTDRPGWIRKVALLRYARPPGPRRRVLAVPVPDIPETAQPDAGHGDLAPGTMLVLDALRSLDLLPRTVMALHMDEFSGPEIAAQLGITQQQARDLLKKARKILAAKLADPGVRVER